MFLDENEKELGITESLCPPAGSSQEGRPHGDSVRTWRVRGRVFVLESAAHCLVYSIPSFSELLFFLRFLFIDFKERASMSWEGSLRERDKQTPRLSAEPGSVS